MDAEALLNNRLGLDDSFDFKCRECGKCCHERHDLLLTAYDVFRIAQYLQTTPKAIIEKNCEVYVGGSTRLPVVKAKPKSHEGVCPFLNKGKCKVHAVKPVVCAVFPLARITSSDNEVFYAFNPANCGEKGETITVRDWVQKFNVPATEAAARVWSEALFYLTPYMQNQEKRQRPKDMLQNMWNAIFGATYLLYNTAQEFIPQFEQNFASLKVVLAELEKAR